MGVVEETRELVNDWLETGLLIGLHEITVFTLFHFSASAGVQLQKRKSGRGRGEQIFLQTPLPILKRKWVVCVNEAFARVSTVLTR